MPTRKPSAPPPSPKAPQRRRGLLLGGIAALTLAAGVAGWSLYRQRGGGTGPPEAVEPAEQALREAVRRAPRDAAAHRELGGYLLEHGRPFEAVWSFQDTIDLRSDDPEARLGVAHGLIAAGLPRLALTALAERSEAKESANSQPDQKTKAGQRAVAASAYLAMGDGLGAVALLSPVQQHLEPEALLALGHAAEALDDGARAGAAYRQYLQAEPNSVEGLLALGRLATRYRLWDEATTALNRARRVAPDDPRPVYHLGLALQARAGPGADSERPGSAIALFQQIIATHPEFGPAHRQLGLWHLRHHRARSAAEALERAVAAGGGDDETRLRLAEALQAVGEPARAAYQRGLAFMEAQQPHRAAREYRRMAELDQSRPDAFLLLSTVYAKMDEPGQAAKVAAKGLERHPNEPRLLARRAQLLLMSGDRAAGARLCRDWLKRDPRAAEPYRLLGSSERQAMHHAEAIRLCEQAMALDPRNAEYCRETARALVGTGAAADLRRAAVVLRRAVSLAPGDAGARLLLGDVLQRLGDLAGARSQLLRGLDLNPGDRTGAVALSQLCPRLERSARVGFYGQIIRALQEREDAARSLWRRVFRDPADADSHAGLAALLLEAADLPQARYQLVQTLALQPARKTEREQLQIVEKLLALREP
jgi:tetratricopeptide (TPR) repeat protein